jgi:hypothetical protein
VRTIAPVGQFSRQPALLQCLQTSDISSQEKFPSAVCWSERAAGRSMKATWRQVEAPTSPVLSYDMPVNDIPSSGSWFHSLHATSHALQPMQTVVSVKNPVPIRHAPRAGSRLLAFLGLARFHSVDPCRSVTYHRFVARDFVDLFGRHIAVRYNAPTFTLAARFDVAGKGL